MHHQKEKMTKLRLSREGIGMDSLAMVCITPLKVNLRQRRAPEETQHDLQALSPTRNSQQRDGVDDIAIAPT
jgi:hypothetical protein